MLEINHIEIIQIRKIEESKKMKSFAKEKLGEKKTKDGERKIKKEMKRGGAKKIEDVKKNTRKGKMKGI